MGGRGGSAAARLLVLFVVVLVASACSPQGTGAEEPSERDRLQRYADDAPAVLLARVQDAYAETAMRVTVRRLADERDLPYTFIADQGAWRVERPTADEEEGDGTATLLVSDDEICFDEEFRPDLTQAVLMSYGFVEFDPKPWSCTAAEFGLNALVTQSFEREDPRWRIENLTTDPGSATVEVEEVDGEPLLHLSTTGVTYGGPLDPVRPPFDLWVGSDLRPVRMETTTLTWDFDYPEDLDGELTPPAPEEQGSYGYVIGPGHGTAKACYWSGECPELPDMTWGDGR